MATQINDLTEDHNADVAIDNDTGEIVNDNEGSEGEEGHSGDDAEEVDEVTWGDTTVAAEEESEGVRNLREQLKIEKQRRKDAEARNAPKVDPVGDKPNMDDYWENPEQFEVDLLAWNERKRTASERETQQEEAARKQRERWEAQARDLDTGYGELRAAGKDAARSTVEDQFPGEQFAYLVKAAGKNAPAFILALGSAANKRDELKALAADGSWAEFIATAAVMAKEVNVQRRKPTTAPDQNHAASGASGGGANSGNQALARLHKKAQDSGDWTEYLAYKRKLNNA